MLIAFREMSELDGSWEPSLNTITIDPRQSPEQMKATLFHELTHATLDFCGIGELLDKNMPGLSETIAVCLENFLRPAWQEAAQSITKNGVCTDAPKN